MKHLLFLLLALALACAPSRDAGETVVDTDENTETKVMHDIPDVLANLEYRDGKLVFVHPESGKVFQQIKHKPLASIGNFLDPATGTGVGVDFDFNHPDLNGTLYFGLILHRPYKNPLPVYFKRTAEIKAGKASVDIKNTFKGKYDISGWEESGHVQLGYRVIDSEGLFYYDGKIGLRGKGPFEVVPSITEGPFINLLTDKSAVVYFTTNKPIIAKLKINNAEFSSAKEGLLHSIEVNNLNPDTEYDYTIDYTGGEFSSSFKTAPEKGSRKPFTFAFTSDSRNGPGGGERHIYGVNAYIMKRMAALASSRNVNFMQFTGDMIDGYLPDYGEQMLQYANWKRAIDDYMHAVPLFVGMGNHESLLTGFDTGEGYGASVDKFPYGKYCGQAAFAEAFENPKNGPVSEDGSKYDPDPSKMDFPSYEENCFYYTHGNTAMIVLNSNYWFSPSEQALRFIGGNLHGYIMDNQLAWLDSVVTMLDGDTGIDHIFVTQHTPAFPNGGHADDDMWYSGNNTPRATIGGKPVEKGIIERRDEYLDILINKTTKTVAILTGDEHNYSRLKIDSETKIYPEGWDKPKLEISNPIWHIVNGAAGAPYYGQEQLPWTPRVEKFTARNALCLFNINGKSVEVEVIDPVTLEELEKVKLK